MINITDTWDIKICFHGALEEGRGPYILELLLCVNDTCMISAHVLDLILFAPEATIRKTGGQ